MVLHAQILETPFDDHITNARQRAFWRRYQSASKDSGDAIPALATIMAEPAPGLEAWSFRLLTLPGGDFIYTHHGEALAQATGQSLLGHRTSIRQDHTGRFFHECFEQIKERSLPYFTRSSDLSGNDVAGWRTLIVPTQDAAGQLNIVGVQHPEDRRHAMLRGLMQLFDAPVFAIQMIRDSEQAVIDARVIDMNEHGATLLNANSRRHLCVSDCAPQLLQGPLREAIDQAFIRAERYELTTPISVNGHTFCGAVTAPNGDGAVIMLRPQLM